MGKNRNPYAAAHSMRGGAGAGAHRDRRRDIEESWADPYSPEWVDACPATSGSGPRLCPDTGVRVKGYKPLSREFLLGRGYCCNTGCTNCPYESTPLTGSEGGGSYPQE